MKKLLIILSIILVEFSLAEETKITQSNYTLSTYNNTLFTSYNYICKNKLEQIVFEKKLYGSLDFFMSNEFTYYATKTNQKFSTKEDLNEKNITCSFYTVN